MSSWREELASFELEVMYNTTITDFGVRVTNDEGDTPVLSAVDAEPLGELMADLFRTGGYGTVFVKGPVDSAGSYKVSRLEFVDAVSTLSEDATDLTGDEAPSSLATVGMLVDFVRTQSEGVRLPLQLGISATGIAPIQGVEFEPVGA